MHVKVHTHTHTYTVYICVKVIHISYIYGRSEDAKIILLMTLAPLLLSKSIKSRLTQEHRTSKSTLTLYFKNLLNQILMIIKFLQT